jgi:3-dehydrosphinganine reductase
MNDGRLQGTRALVTGGSSGIGLAIAADLAARGIAVHIAARDRTRLDAALRTFDGAGADVRTHDCDVASAPDVAALFARLRADGAMPDIIVNSAGISCPGYFETLPLADFDRVMRVNYFGTLHVLKEAVPHLIALRRGWILNVASVAGLMGVFGMAPYAASKFAVRGLSETLRAELKPHGITVSLLCPPDTDTPMLQADVARQPVETTALSKAAGVLSAAEVARAALAGLARGRAIIVPGRDARLTTLLLRLAPGLVERLSDRIVRRARDERGPGGGA